MEKQSLLLLLVFFSVLKNTVNSQTFTTNVTPVGMEHNMLFNAEKRFTVTQDPNGPQFNLSTLFNGAYAPSYTSTAPTPSNPSIITIENIPYYHIQRGAWVGWTTRYWGAKNFKIEAYNTYLNANEWVVVADYSTIDYSGGTEFSMKMPGASGYTKLRFTFYSSNGTDGRMGLSEIFYIHPEGTTPYRGLFGSWTNSEDLLSANSNLHVNGELSVKAGEGFKLYGDSNYFGTNYDGVIFEIQDTNGSNAAVDGGFVFKGFTTTDQVSKDLMVIKGAGNVGIGTTTPQNKLSVNGTIWATKVKVTLEDAADWVFEDDYKLRSLKEVENFIKTNKHLPEIPSAEEFRANDMEVSEMTNKLLQKIEELTLYTINQEKELKVQAEKLQTQEQKLKKMNDLEIRLQKIEALLLEK